MESYIDLHTHSVYSEGALTCQELIAAAKKNSIKILSLTDHNVIDGVQEIINHGKKEGLHIIPGVEIYTRYKNIGFHLLGYNFKQGDSKLLQALVELQNDHLIKLDQCLASLIKQGFTINKKNLLEGPSKYIGVVHIIKELEKNKENIAKMNQELQSEHNNYFGKVYHYFGYGQPAHLPHSELPTPEAVDIINQSGGFSVLAHPGQQLTFEQSHIIDELSQQGLNGLEVLSPYHNWHQIEHYQKIAMKNDLLITGGSDFHTDIDFKGPESIKRQWDYFKVPYSIYKNLKQKISNI